MSCEKRENDVKKKPKRFCWNKKFFDGMQHWRFFEGKERKTENFCGYRGGAHIIQSFR